MGESFDFASFQRFLLGENAAMVSQIAIFPLQLFVGADKTAFLGKGMPQGGVAERRIPFKGWKYHEDWSSQQNCVRGCVLRGGD
jgi:hypothetical protein